MSHPTFQQYLDALSALGVAPGATLDDIRRAHKAILAICHPDRYPGDKTKEARAKEANNAKDTLEAVAKAGLLSVWGTRFTYGARTGRTAGDASGADARSRAGVQGDGFIVWVVVAPAGAGKTYGWTRAQAGALMQPNVLVPGTGATHVILASPTIELTNQTASQLKEVGHDDRTVTVIHSKNTNGGVRQAVDNYHAGRPAGQNSILLITHTAILTAPIPHAPGKASDWDLVFDEMPDTVKFLEIDGYSTHFHITSHLEAIPHQSIAGLLILRPKTSMDADDPDVNAHFARLVRISVNRYPKDGGLEHYKEMARAIVAGHEVMVKAGQWNDLLAQGREHRGHLDILVLVPPHWFRGYRRVTIMGARALSHMTSLVWGKLFGVDFRLDTSLNLPKVHTKKQIMRLTVHYIFEDRATRAFLARKATAGGSLFMAVCSSVAQFYATQKYKPFLWSAPLEGEDKEHGVKDTFWQTRKEKPRSKGVNAFDPKLRLPGRTHGLNFYMDKYNVALLSVINFTPDQWKMLEAIGLTEEEINKAVSFDVAYQDMARCNIRDRNGAHKIHVTVLDKPTAVDIAAEFQGCKVVRYPAHLIPNGIVRTGKRGPATTGTAKSAADRQRSYRARKAALVAAKDEQARESSI